MMRDDSGAKPTSASEELQPRGAGCIHADSSEAGAANHIILSPNLLQYCR
jgi:hypothetical protein